MPFPASKAQEVRGKMNNNEKTLVLGLGNVLMGDEGIGIYVVREIEKHQLPLAVECLDGGTGGFTLLEPLENADRIIIIDAASDGNPVGTVTRTMPLFSRDYPPTLTAHDVGMKDLLDMFYIQGGHHEIILYAITIDPRQPIRMSLSAMGEKAAAEAAELILAELDSCGIAYQGACGPFEAENVIYDTGVI